MSRGTIAALILLLAGCVNPQVKELRDWAGTAKQQVKAGQMKWSDYYKGLYSRLAQLPDMQGRYSIYEEPTS